MLKFYLPEMRSFLWFEATRTFFSCQCTFGNGVYRIGVKIFIICWHNVCSFLGTVRNHYKGLQAGYKGLRAGEVNNMLAGFMKSLTRVNEECPLVLSITDTTTAAITRTEGVIHRNHIDDSERGEPRDIYLRAREIYFRARLRHRPVRAASIF